MSKNKTELMQLADELDLDGDKQWQLVRKYGGTGESYLFEFCTCEEAGNIVDAYKHLGMEHFLNAPDLQISADEDAEGKLVQVEEQDSLSHVIDEETGRLVEISPEMKRQLKDAETMMVVGDLIKCIQWARIQDQKLYLAAGCSSMEEYVTVNHDAVYRSIRNKINVGRALGRILPDWKTFSSQDENHQLNEVLGDLSQVSLSKWYELTKLPEADFSEIASRKIVKTADGQEIDVQQIIDKSARQVALQVREVKKQYQKKLAMSEEERKKLTAEVETLQREKEKHKETIKRAEELDLLYSGEAGKFQELMRHIDHANKAIIEAERALFRCKIDDDMPEAIHMAVHNIISTSTNMQANAFRKWPFLRDLEMLTVSDDVIKKAAQEKKPDRIRTDKTRMAIKVQSWDGEYSHGWKNLENGFETEQAMESRFSELLESELYVEG